MAQQEKVFAIRPNDLSSIPTVTITLKLYRRNTHTYNK